MVAADRSRAAHQFTAVGHLGERIAMVGALLATGITAHTWLNATLMRRAHPSAPPVDAGTTVSVLIPARNEALRIAPTVRSVLACDGVPTMEVLVLDDHSTDATVEVVRHAADGDARVRVLSGAELPPGWLGKPYACEQLGRAAQGSVLVFVDADVVLDPSALRASVDLLRRHRLQLVSPYPRQVAASAPERLVQPLLQWLWLSFLPLRLAERPRPVSMAAANGQLLAVDADAWRAVGGHASVRHEVIEDVALAVAFKRSGFRATVAEGSAVATCRMYTGWADLQEGYTKSLWAAVPAGPAVGVAMLFGLAYLVPVAAAVAGVTAHNRRVTAIGLAGYIAGVAGRIVSARATGGAVGDAVAHPGSVATLLALGVRSHRARRAGRLVWKGRSIDAS